MNLEGMEVALQTLVYVDSQIPGKRRLYARTDWVNAQLLAMFEVSLFSRSL